MRKPSVLCLPSLRFCLLFFFSEARPASWSTTSPTSCFSFSPHNGSPYLLPFSFSFFKGAFFFYCFLFWCRVPNLGPRACQAGVALLSYIPGPLLLLELSPPESLFGRNVYLFGTNTLTTCLGQEGGPTMLKSDPGSLNQLLRQVGDVDGGSAQRQDVRSRGEVRDVRSLWVTASRGARHRT